jgi:hypothetical protein
MGELLFLDGNDGQEVYIDEYKASLVTFCCFFIVIVMIGGSAFYTVPGGSAATRL